MGGEGAKAAVSSSKALAPVWPGGGGPPLRADTDAIADEASDAFQAGLGRLIFR